VLVTSTGPVPCTLTLEPFFVETFLKLAAMRQPLAATEALEFMNATITNTTYENEVVEWKTTIKRDKEGQPTLGKKYWRGFLKRHPILSIKSATHFDSFREEWYNVDNFEWMYNECYEKMVEAKVASKVDEEVWLDKKGRIVGLEDDAFGRKTNYLMRKPEFVVFVDEVGDNTSQKNDGNIAGTKYVVSKMIYALKKAPHHDNHFRTL
jgi:hypothetical protein